MVLDRVLVPLDFGLAADRAQPVAQVLAHKLGLTVDAVVVTSRGVAADADEDEAHWHARQAGCRPTATAQVSAGIRVVESVVPAMFLSSTRSAPRVASTTP
jgi:hypothetical protein